MRETPIALIVGAGIGGLAAALTLRRIGWDVRVYERSPTPRELGFGLLLAPNALSALRELGVADPIVRAGAPPARIEIRRTNGRVLRRLDAQVGGPSVVALRSELHGALLAAVGDTALRLGREAVSFSQDAGHATLALGDGSTDAGTVLIGADGVNSILRRTLHPDEPPPLSSRFCAVRGVAFGVGDRLGNLSGVAYLDDGLEAATVRAGSDAVYWYLSLLTRDVPDSMATPAAILQPRIEAFEPPLRAILCATEPDDERFDRLFERAPLETWGTGRVTLLGDAAHPLLPHTGQGAAQALEDAVALGLSLTGSEDVERALRRYEAVRSRRTKTFIRLGPRIARVTTTKSTTIKIARSIAIRLLPERLLALSMVKLHEDPHRELRVPAAG